MEPEALAAALAPSHADWLNDLSSTLPVSVTSPIQKTRPVPQSASVAAFEGAAKPRVASATAATVAVMRLIMDLLSRDDALRYAPVNRSITNGGGMN